jgi:hypothetical protein
MLQELHPLATRLQRILKTMMVMTVRLIWRTSLCFLLLHAGLQEGQKNIAFAVLARRKLPLAVNIGRISVDAVEGLGTLRGLVGRLFDYYSIYLIHN